MPLPILLAAVTITGGANSYVGGPNANEPAVVEIIDFQAKNTGATAATLRVTGGTVVGCEDVPDLPRRPKIDEVAVAPAEHGKPDATITIPPGATKWVDLHLEPFHGERTCTLTYRVSLVVDGKPRTADLPLEFRFRLPEPESLTP